MPTTGNREEGAAAGFSVASGGAPPREVGEVPPLDLRRVGRLLLEGPLMKERAQRQVGGPSVPHGKQARGRLLPRLQDLEV